MKDNNNLSVFKIGKPLPEMFAKYFIGNAHLNMLTTEGVSIGNVTFEPGCRNNWHIIIKEVKFYLLLEAGGIIKLGVRKQWS